MNVLERDFFTDPRASPGSHSLLRCAPGARAGGARAAPGRLPDLRHRRDPRGLRGSRALLGDRRAARPVGEAAGARRGESLAEVLERRRAEIPLSDPIMTLDPPKHTRHRALMGKLFTPNRLKENEEFMWTLADGLIDELGERGEVEFCAAYARPFTLLVIADLLGVPREDHKMFRGWLGGATGQRRRSRRPAERRSGVREPASLLRPLHRGASRRAAGRRDEPAGQRPLPRRRAPGGDGRRASRHHPLRRRTGDHGAPDLRGHAHPRRAARSRRGAPRAIPRRLRTSWRSACASRAPSRAPSAWRCGIRRLGGVDDSGGVDAHGDGRRRQPRCARLRGPRPLRCEALRTPGATSPSVTPSTSVPARASPAPRRASASIGCSHGSTTCELVDPSALSYAPTLRHPRPERPAAALPPPRVGRLRSCPSAPWPSSSRWERSP